MQRKAIGYFPESMIFHDVVELENGAGRTACDFRFVEGCHGGFVVAPSDSPTQRDECGACEDEIAWQRRIAPKMPNYHPHWTKPKAWRPSDGV